VAIFVLKHWYGAFMARGGGEQGRWRNGIKGKDRQNGGEYRKIGVSSQHK